MDTPELLARRRPTFDERDAGPKVPASTGPQSSLTRVSLAVGPRRKKAPCTTESQLQNPPPSARAPPQSAPPAPGEREAFGTRRLLQATLLEREVTAGPRSRFESSRSRPPFYAPEGRAIFQAARERKDLASHPTGP